MRLRRSLILPLAALPLAALVASSDLDAMMYGAPLYASEIPPGDTVNVAARWF